MVHRTVFVSFMVGPGRTPGFMSVHVWFGAQPLRANDCCMVGAAPPFPLLLIKEGRLAEITFASFMGRYHAPDWCLSLFHALLYLHWFICLAFNMRAGHSSMVT